MASEVSDKTEAPKAAGGDAHAGAVATPAAEKTFMTVPEAQKAQEAARNPETQRKETETKVKAGAADACNKEVGDGKAIATAGPVRDSIEAGKVKDPSAKIADGKLNFDALTDTSLKDLVNGGKDGAKDKINTASSINVGDGKGDKAVAVGQGKPESMGGAEALTLSRGQGRPAPAGDQDAGKVKELPGKFGEKPPGSDKNVDRTPEQQKEDNIKGVTDNYRASLEKAGVRPEQADKLVADMQKNLETTQKRLEQNPDKLIDQRTGEKSTPEAQMKRICGALNDVLEGKTGPYNDSQRSMLASSMAGEISNPDNFNKQGAHMTCALSSLSKQRLEAGDPASVLEEAASVINKGGAFTGTDHPQDANNGIGAGRTWTKVDATSIMPDGESNRYFDANYHGTEGKRDLFTQVNNGLYGQKAADLKAEHEGKPNGSYVYMAAHSDTYGGQNGQTKTGEGMFAVGQNGSKTLVDDNPGVGLYQVAELNQSLTGRAGGMFAQKDLAGDPPKGYENVKITTFDNAQDFKQKLGAWQDKTGTSAQIGVDAPFLPGGGENGHGLHAMNAKLDKDGNIQFINNWSSKFDMKVTDQQFDKATNPSNWNPHGDGSDHSGPRPDNNTIFRPGSGSNPNETLDDRNKRLTDDKSKDDDKKKDESKNKEKDELQQKQDQNARDKASFDIQHQAWAAKKAAADAAHKPFDEQEPSFTPKY